MELTADDWDAWKKSMREEGFENSPDEDSTARDAEKLSQNGLMVAFDGVRKQRSVKIIDFVDGMLGAVSIPCWSRLRYRNTQREFDTKINVGSNAGPSNMIISEARRKTLTDPAVVNYSIYGRIMVLTCRVVL